MQKIIGLGNALVDILAQIPDNQLLKRFGLPEGSMQFIQPEQQQPINEALKPFTPQCVAGGSAANTLKGLSQLGIETTFIGKVGDDAFGQLFNDSLKEQGVTPNLIVDSSHPTGTATTLITPNGERTFADLLGAASCLKSVELNPQMFKGYDMLYIEGYLVQNHDLISNVLTWAKALGLTTCLDLASYNVVEQDRGYFRRALRNCVDIVFANEEEAHALTGFSGEQSARALGNYCPTAIVKLGERGACAYSHGILAQSNSFRIDNVVDTTGAGDSFAAGFLYKYGQYGALQQSLSAGNYVAAEVIQHIGASLPKETWKKLAENL